VRTDDSRSVAQDATDARPLDGIYDHAFYQSHKEGASRSAEVVAEFLCGFYKPKSVIDLGCGTGVWLRAFVARGIEDVLGVDGPHVPLADLEIDSSHFQSHDFRSPFAIDRGFDLAISTEVAEHLPESSARLFVASLARLAPVVLFSAAIPGQPGDGHVNCKWPGYWAELFNSVGFEAFDCIREPLWDDERIAWWYRQNLVLYTSEPRIVSGSSPGVPPRLVHPGNYAWVLDRYEQLLEELESCQGVMADATLRGLLSALPSRIRRSLSYHWPYRRSDSWAGSTLIRQQRRRV